MKTFKYNIGGKDVTLRLDDRCGTIADVLVDGEHPAVPEAKMPVYAAVIALALIEHEVEVVHDEETGVITLASRSSAWGNPAQLMNRL